MLRPADALSTELRAATTPGEQQVRLRGVPVQSPDQGRRNRGAVDVVLRQLEQLALAQQVRPRVADVQDAEPRTGPEQRGQGGAGVLEVPDRGAGHAEGVPECVQRIAGGQRVQRFDRLDRGDARLVPAGAEPVGDGEQVRTGVGRVLLRFAHQTRTAWTSPVIAVSFPDSCATRKATSRPRAATSASTSRQ